MSEPTEMPALCVPVRHPPDVPDPCPVSWEGKADEFYCVTYCAYRDGCQHLSLGVGYCNDGEQFPIAVDEPGVAFGLLAGLVFLAVLHRFKRRRA